MVCEAMGFVRQMLEVSFVFFFWGREGGKGRRVGWSCEKEEADECFDFDCNVCRDSSLCILITSHTGQSIIIPTTHRLPPSHHPNYIARSHSHAR